MNDNIHCAGTLFLAKDTMRFLFLLRAQTRSAGTWGLVGGKIEESDDSPHGALRREIQEEIGFLPNIEKTLPIERYVSHDEFFYYNTYVTIVDKEFIPKLNNEHWGYTWVEYGHWPRPLHQGLRTTLNSKTIRTKLETIIELL